MKAIVCGLDNVLFNLQLRQILTLSRVEGEFHSEHVNDTVYPDVYRAVVLDSQDVDVVIFMTERPDTFRASTEAQLDELFGDMNRIVLMPSAEDLATGLSVRYTLTRKYIEGKYEVTKLYDCSTHNLTFQDGVAKQRILAAAGRLSNYV